MGMPQGGASVPLRPHPLSNFVAQLEQKFLEDVESWFVGKELPRALDHLFDPPRSHTEHLTRCTVCDVDDGMAPSQHELRVLDGKQLFVDDFLIESAVSIQRFLEEPQRYDVPIFARTEPWETARVGFPGSVNHNGTHFLMHYSAARFSDGYERIGLAASQDGFTWNKQLLNTSFSARGGDFCVLLDRFEVRPALRFKMVYNCKVPHNHACVASSPDGIHWRASRLRLGRWADTVPCMYHDKPGLYDIMLREEFSVPFMLRGVRGTKVLRNKEPLVDDHGMVPRARLRTLGRWYLDRTSKFEWVRRQVYAHTRFLYEGVYLSFVHVYEWPAINRLPVDKANLRSLKRALSIRNLTRSLDSVRPYLATSRDGVRYNFQWVYGNIPLSLEGEHRQRWIQPAAQMVSWGGFHWLYFTESPVPHQHRLAATESFRLARYELDRISGLEVAGNGPGTVITKPFDWTKRSQVLGVNVFVPPGSACDVSALIDGKEQGVELISIKGTRDSDRLANGPSLGAVCAPVFQMVDAAESGADVPHVRLRFTLTGASKLYAFLLQAECGGPHCRCDPSILADQVLD